MTPSPYYPADDQRTRADLLYKRGLALRSLGRWEEALADWREALAAYEELDDAEAVARVCYELSAQLGWAARWDEAVEVARRGLRALGQQVSVDRCRLAAAAGWELSLGGDYAGGDAMLTEGLAMAEELGDRHLLGLVLSMKAQVHVWYLQPREAVDAGLRAAELLRSAGDLWALADTLWYTQYALISSAASMKPPGWPRRRRAWPSAWATWAPSWRSGAVAASTNLSLTGDIDRFEEFARADLELCRSAGMPWISNSYTYLGLAHFWRGRWDQALESFREAARLEPPGMLAGYDWAGLFMCQAYMGDKDAALAALEERREGLPRPGRANIWGAWAMLFAAVEGLAVLGEREEAAKLYPLVLEAVNSGALVYWPRGYFSLWPAWRPRPAASGRRRRSTTRRPCARPTSCRSSSSSRRCGAGTPACSSTATPPATARRRASSSRRAIAMYRRIGMPKHVEMAEEMLGEIGS